MTFLTYIIFIAVILILFLLVTVIQDLYEIKAQLTEAMSGGKIDPESVKKLTQASDALEKSVESNQPKISGQ